MKGADTLVLAVKPQDMKRALASLGSEVRGALVISVAAGITLETLSRWLGGHRKIVRCMPNTPGLIGAGITGLYASAKWHRERKQAEAILRAVGDVVWLSEETADRPGDRGFGERAGLRLLVHRAARRRRRSSSAFRTTTR